MPLREIFAILKVKWDNSDLKKGMKDLSGATKRIRQFGASLAGVFGARKLVRVLNDTGDELDRLAKLGRGLDIPVEGLQNLEFALERLGGDPGSVRNMFVSLAKALGEAETGSKEYVDSFKQIGLNFRDLQGLAPVDQFLKIQGAMKAAEGSAQSMAGASIILGRGFKSNLPVFKATNSEVAALFAEREAIGGYTQAQADLGEEVADTRANFDQAAKALKGIAFEAVAPKLIETIKLFQELAKWTEKSDQGMVALGGALLVVGGLITASLGPIPFIVFGIAAGITTLITLWDDLKWAIEAFLEPLGIFGKVLAEIVKFGINPLGRIIDGIQTALGFFGGGDTTGDARTGGTSRAASGAAGLRFSPRSALAAPPPQAAPPLTGQGPLVPGPTNVYSTVNIDATGMTEQQVKRIVRDERERGNRAARSRG